MSKSHSNKKTDPSSSSKEDKISVKAKKAFGGIKKVKISNLGVFASSSPR